MKYFLGIKVVKSRHGIFILQRKYVFDLLKGTRLLRYKAIDKSVERNNTLGKNNESPLIDKSRYEISLANYFKLVSHSSRYYLYT